MKNIMCAAAVIVMAMATAFAESKINLPGDLPVLEITGDAQLGTNENNIGLTKGEKVSDFTALAINKEEVKFSSLLNDQHVMVVFYRGGWCPYCNVQVRQLSVAADEFSQRKVTPVLISADKPDAAMLVQKGYEIPFPVLSDADLAAHKAFNVVFRLPDELVPMYKKYGIDLSDWSGQKHQRFAVASVFIVDKNGEVLWAHTSTDYKKRPSVKQLLTVIDGLKARS